MATLTPTPGGYVAGIYRIETTDEALGGESGTANIQAKQLANRTDYLKGKVDTFESQTLDDRLDVVEGTTAGFDGRIDSLEAKVGGFVGNKDVGAANYTLLAGDSGKVVRVNGSGLTVTMPSGLLPTLDSIPKVYRIFSQFAFTFTKAASAGSINWFRFDASGNDVSSSNNTSESLAIAKNKMVTVYMEGNTMFMYY